MIGYYISLAARSLRGTPVLSTLMIAAIAVGVGACMTVLTLNYMMSQNALAHKDDVLYAVQLDSWDPNEGFTRSNNNIPYEMTYQDASALLRSDIPKRQVAMHRYGFTITQDEGDIRPFAADARVTTKDFFALFDVPFLYGGSWAQRADTTPEQVVVLSERTNEKLFGGENSVGRVVNLNGHLFTVTGVIKHWNPSPKVYDLNNSPFAPSEALFVPFGLHRTFEIYSWGNTNGWTSNNADAVEGYEGFLQSESVWIQYWVELDSADSKEKYQQFLTNYIRQQKDHGRFERPLKFALTTPSDWIVLNEVVKDDNRILGWVSIAFLLVCVVNAVALLLAKFLRKAPEAGVRRALGASRNAVFIQHLVESACIGILGGLLGILLAVLGLGGIRVLALGRIDQVASMDWLMMLTAIGLALLASLLAGLYPAWRISHTNPSIYLKTQ